MIIYRLNQQYMTQVNINDERSVRINKLNELEEQNITAYPSKSSRTHYTNEALEEPLDAEVTVAGRIVLKRSFGKLAFCKVQDKTGNIQTVFKHDELSAEAFDQFKKLVDLGDIISVTGKRFQTQKGEESVLANSWTMLSKALRPLPDKHKGLQDDETRLRKRYLDFISNPELKNLFVQKSVFWNSVRDFLRKEGFLEVETPVLESTPGGADAEPFMTHHNSLDIDVFLRISMGELWQKRLMVAGFDKTFEIGRQFRNEGMSREHLQDYTQMEFYWSYANYEQSMELVEKMYKEVLTKTFGKSIFTIGQFEDIDINQKWGKIDYVDTIKQAFDIDVSEASEQELRDKINSIGIDGNKIIGKGRLMDTLWKQVRKTIKGPAFLINQPVEISPLAKRKENDRSKTEKYQIMIAGSELGNGYTELNDPIDQASRFAEQAKLREEGDVEAQMHDQDFVEALEYGMPPTTGFGFSERVFSFFADKPIRECVLFPLMKPESDHESTDE